MFLQHCQILAHVLGTYKSEATPMSRKPICHPLRRERATGNVKNVHYSRQANYIKKEIVPQLNFLLWELGDRKKTQFAWLRVHFGIERNKVVDQKQEVVWSQKLILIIDVSQKILQRFL